MSADVALSEKSPYLGGAQARWGLSNNPESMESCRFEIRGFAGFSDLFCFRMSTRVSSFFQMGPSASGAH